MVSSHLRGARVCGKKVLLVTFAVLLPSVVGIGLQTVAGESAVAVSLRTLQGAEISVSKQDDRISLPGVQARAVLVNFWATWCDPCREEVPDLVRLFEKYQAQGLLVIGISFDTSMEKLHKFIKDYKVPYPVWVGNKSVVRKWVIRGLPISYLVDSEGIIRKRYMGARKGVFFENDFKELLEPVKQGKAGRK